MTSKYSRCSQCGHWFDPMPNESTTTCYLCSHHETAETVVQKQQGGAGQCGH